MNEHPIIFSTKMVKEIIEDRRTLTSRIMRPQPKGNAKMDWLMDTKTNNQSDMWIDQMEVKEIPNGQIPKSYKCPYGAPGDNLWVRESFGYTWKGELVYKTDNPRIPKNHPYKFKWKPSIHMPKAVSRITLRVLKIWPERVQNITEEMAVKEGVDLSRNVSAVESFAELWDSINGERIEGSWFDDPWVWRVEFSRIE